MGSKNRSSPSPPWFRGGIRVAFDENTGANHSVVAAPGAGFKLRLLGWQLGLGAGNTLTWKSGTTAISGPITFAAAGPYEPIAGMPWLQFYETAENEALVLTLGSAQQVSGDIWYEKVAVLS